MRCAEAPLAHRAALAGLDREYYDQINSALLAGKDEVILPGGLDADRAFTVYLLVLRDNPGIIHVSGNARTVGRKGNGIVRARFSRIRTDAQARCDLARMERAAARILSHASRQSGAEAQALAAHDALMRGCFADERSKGRCCAANALLGRGATCGGYALAYKFLLDRLGIGCIAVSGWTGEEARGRVRSGKTAASGSETSHAWNAIKVEEGWTYVDAFWDVSHVGGSLSVHHAWWGLSDSELSGHVPARMGFVPVCTASLGYYGRRGLEPRTIEEARRIVEAAGPTSPFTVEMRLPLGTRDDFKAAARAVATAAARQTPRHVAFVTIPDRRALLLAAR